MRPTDAERFWSKVAVGKWWDCWPWLGASTDGYGYFHLDGRMQRAHRVAYELLVGPIPVGLDLDHVKAWGCTRRDCVNPLHAEPVTRRENLMRSSTAPAAVNARKTHCDAGHEFTPENTIEQRGPRGGRRCLVCHRDYQRNWAARKRARLPSARDA